MRFNIKPGFVDARKRRGKITSSRYWVCQVCHKRKKRHMFYQYSIHDGRGSRPSQVCKSCEENPEKLKNSKYRYCIKPPKCPNCNFDAEYGVRRTKSPNGVKMHHSKIEYYCWSCYKDIVKQYLEQGFCTEVSTWKK